MRVSAAASVSVSLSDLPTLRKPGIRKGAGQGIGAVASAQNRRVRLAPQVRGMAAKRTKLSDCRCTAFQ